MGKFNNMVSFLNKMKGASVNEGLDDISANKEEKKNLDFAQVDVDIFQAGDMYIVVASLPGVDINELDVSIENENDTVTIQGKKDMPAIDNISETRKYLRQECKWGEFYRQIILPQEINITEVTSKFEKGILVIKLPVLRLQGKGKKKIKIG